MEGNKINKVAGNILIAILRGYQKIISPSIGRHCRFYPTCSEYFIQSVRKKGVMKGSVSGLLRILRCNPFNPGGFDPVK